MHIELKLYMRPTAQCWMLSIAYDQLSGLHKTYLQTLKDDSSPPAVALLAKRKGQCCKWSLPPPLLPLLMMTDPHWDATAGAARSQDSTGGW
jgi:hypothetical protein